jgi:hypothetical protein
LKGNQNPNIKSSVPGEGGFFTRRSMLYSPEARAMKFKAAQNFTSLAELMRFYGDADEIVFKSHGDLDEQEIAGLCRDARRLVHQCRLRHGAKRAAEIARLYGIAVSRDDWQAAKEKRICLAEHRTHPPKISLNMDAIRSLAGLMRYWANENERVWFTEALVAEVAIANEFYHLIEPRTSSPSVELAAHAFARAYISLPFSPLLYHVLLLRLVKGNGVGT